MTSARASEPAEAATHRIAASALANLREAVLVVGPDFRYVYVNDASVMQAHMPREQLLGRTIMECYPGIEATPFFDKLRSCVQDRTPGEMTNPFTFADGASGWFEVRFEPVPDGAAILSVDVTAAKRADETLRRKSRALAMLSECNQALVRATEKRKFLQAVCELAVNHGGYRMAWIGPCGA